jgi:hypothetical protein
LGDTLLALVRLGHAVLALGEAQRAMECFHRALREAVEAAFLPEALSALVGAALLSAREGGTIRATELLALALHHPATYHEDKLRAQKLLSHLESELAPEALSAAIARGQARELKEVAGEVLKRINARDSD